MVLLSLKTIQLEDLDEEVDEAVCVYTRKVSPLTILTNVFTFNFVIFFS